MGGRGEGLNLQKKPVAILNVNRKKVVCTIQIPRLILKRVGVYEFFF